MFIYNSILVTPYDTTNICKSTGEGSEEKQGVFYKAWIYVQS